MPINADKPHLWKPDIAASVDQFNAWFMGAAPKAFRDTRIETTQAVLRAMDETHDHTAIGPKTLKDHPAVLPTLRMSTCPPIAVDRLVGLADANKNLVGKMEEGELPPRMAPATLDEQLGRVADIISRLLDPDLFPWTTEKRKPTEDERQRAATVVADRLTGAQTNPIIRNAQEKRQLAVIGAHLRGRGYKQQAHPSGKPIQEMTPGTFTFRLPVVVGNGRQVNIPIDAVVQPKKLRASRLPILIEAKSAGDFANTNKRRKEEATKVHQLRQTYGSKVEFILFLCGYFDGGYLGYEAAEGIDWIWEHRVADFDQLGI